MFKEIWISSSMWKKKKLNECLLGIMWYWDRHTIIDYRFFFWMMIFSFIIIIIIRPSIDFWYESNRMIIWMNDWIWFGKETNLFFSFFIWYIQTTTTTTLDSTLIRYPSIHSFIQFNSIHSSRIFFCSLSFLSSFRFLLLRRDLSFFQFDNWNEK
mgnify:CR=1 FL=1